MKSKPSIKRITFKRFSETCMYHSCLNPAFCANIFHPTIQGKSKEKDEDARTAQCYKDKCPIW